MCPRRYIGNQLRVSLDANKQAPKSFSWRGKVYHVSEVQECWRLAGAWWDVPPSGIPSEGGREGEKTFFRLLTAGGVICELAYNHANHTWGLERIED